MDRVVVPLLYIIYLYIYIYLYFDIVPQLDLPALEKTPRGTLAPKLIFSVCYGAWLIATLCASEVPW